MTMQTNLTLTGEQKLVLALPLREPVLVRGAAGSGKTTVAVYRARHLYESHHDLFRSGRRIVLRFQRCQHENGLVMEVRHGRRV